MIRFLLFISSIFALAAFTNGQQAKQLSEKKVKCFEAVLSKSSPAYAELLLKKTELQADLESLALEYTEDYPKVQESRYGLVLLQKEAERLIAVKPAESQKLTLALGKLIVRKIELETVLWGLQKNYKDDHPDVKRAKRKVEIYEAAIKEILG